MRNVRFFVALFLGGGLLFAMHGIGPFTIISEATAFEASSTTFFLHGAAQDSITKVGSSSTFIDFPAGGQAVVGRASSSTFIAYKGVSYAMFRTFTPQYTLGHYHWRNDDGTEAAATSATSNTQDTTLSGMALNTIKRIRVVVSSSGGTDSMSTQQFRLEYGVKSTTCAAIASWIDVGAVGGDWDMGDSTNLTDGNNTTNIAVSTGGVTDTNNAFVTSNTGVKDTSSTTGALLVANNQFVELEYSVKPINTASGNYCFRITNAGTATSYVYSVYPESSVTGGAATLTLSIDAGAVVSFGSITAGNLRLTDNTRLKVTNVSATSLTITAGRQRSVSNVTLASGALPLLVSNQISDTAGGVDVFNGISNCSTATSQTATWPSQAGTSSGLGFSNWSATASKDACWGTGTTKSDANNKYAALQASASASSFITANSPASPFFASVGYSLEVKSTQKATSYSGGVVYTATVAP